jgi:hypothetical protein
LLLNIFLQILIYQQTIQPSGCEWQIQRLWRQQNRLPVRSSPVLLLGCVRAADFYLRSLSLTTAFAHQAPASTH